MYRLVEHLRLPANRSDPPWVKISPRSLVIERVQDLISIPARSNLSSTTSKSCFDIFTERARNREAAGSLFASCLGRPSEIRSILTNLTDLERSPPRTVGSVSYILSLSYLKAHRRATDPKCFFRLRFRRFPPRNLSRSRDRASELFEFSKSFHKSFRLDKSRFGCFFLFLFFSFRDANSRHARIATF